MNKPTFPAHALAQTVTLLAGLLLAPTIQAGDVRAVATYNPTDIVQDIQPGATATAHVDAHAGDPLPLGYADAESSRRRLDMDSVAARSGVPFGMAASGSAYSNFTLVDGSGNALTNAQTNGLDLSFNFELRGSHQLSGDFSDLAISFGTQLYSQAQADDLHGNYTAVQVPFGAINCRTLVVNGPCVSDAWPVAGPLDYSMQFHDYATGQLFMGLGTGAAANLTSSAFAHYVLFLASVTLLPEAPIVGITDLVALGAQGVNAWTGGLALRFDETGEIMTIVAAPTGNVPEPGTVALFALGLAGLAVSRRRAAPAIARL